MAYASEGRADYLDLALDAIRRVAQDAPQQE
jgi:hypothetical protein